MNSVQPDLSIVIPALAEEKRIGQTLQTLSEFIQKDPIISKLRLEVLVVAADSNDRTHEIVEQKAVLFKHFALLRPGPKVGKGRDVQYGVLQAHGKVIAYMDADLATPLHHLSKFYINLLDDADIVMATRNIRKHHKDPLRILIANTGNMLFRIAAGLWVEDTQCGFKMFSSHAAKLCFSRMTIQKWGFDMEILAIAKANRLKVVTRRVNDWQDMPFSTFNTSVIRNSLHSLKDLAYIARNRMSGVYTAPKA
jgi:dolichyl-phosphate beta-glucosyltransferase